MEGESDVTADIVEVVDVAEVDVTDTTIDFDDVEEGFADAEDDFTAVGMEDLQSPKPAWQPVPQYVEDEPQRPLLEQQFPNTEFVQVRMFPDCIPQRPVKLRVRALAPRSGRAVMANREKCIVNEAGLNK